VTSLLRAIPAAGTAVLVVALTAGCAVNAGTAKARQLEEDWRGTPDVAEVSASGSNDLPFFGSADGTIVVEPGTSDARVAELLHELGDYVQARDGVSGSLEVGPMTLGARSYGAGNDDVLDLWRALREEPAVVGAELGTWDVAVDLDDPRRFVPLTADLTRPGGALEPLAGTRLTVTAGELRAETSLDGGLAPELSAFRAVAARRPVLEASLTSHRLVLRVGSYDDALAAREDAVAAVPSVADRLVVNGGKVTFDGTPASETVADPGLVAALDARPDVTAVVVQERSLVVAVADLDDARAVEAGLADDDRVDGLDAVTVARSWTGAPAADGAVGFRVDVAGAERADLSVTDVQELAAALPALTAVTATSGTVKVTLDRPSTTDVEASAAELATRVERGTVVDVRADRVFAVVLTAGPRPRADEVPYDTQISADVFVRAWEASWPTP